MTISTYTTIAKTFIKLVKLVVKYEKGELQEIEPSVWDQYIGTKVGVHPAEYTLPDYHPRYFEGKLIEKEESGGITIEDDGQILFFPSAMICKRLDPKRESPPPVRPPNTRGIIRKGI